MNLRLLWKMSEPQLINEKAATMTLGISVAVLIYVAVVVIALRNSYPQYKPWDMPC